MDTEQFIKDSAAQGKSKQQTCKELGVSYRKFLEFLSVMPELPWLTPSERMIQRYQFNPPIQRSDTKTAALARARAARRLKRTHVYKDFKGTYAEIAEKFGISISALHARLKVTRGNLDAAMAIPLHSRYNQDPQLN